MLRPRRLITALPYSINTQVNLLPLLRRPNTHNHNNHIPRTFITTTTPQHKMSTMRAIQVQTWGEAPTFTSTASPPASPTDNSTTTLSVLATALPQLVRSQASGTHYSVRAASLPYTPGVDGVGRTPSNTLAYFTNLGSAGGMAERITVPSTNIFPLPLPPSASDTEQRELGIKVASLVNPALSSWMALTARAKVRSREFAEVMGTTEKGFTVLILGATSASGRLAARFARYLGAGRVVGMARNGEALAEMREAGEIEVAIVLDGAEPAKSDFSVLQRERVHVVLDYIWGATASAVMASLPSSPSKAEELEVRWVHVGSLGRELEASVNGGVLRGKNIVVTGAGPGSWSLPALARETKEMVEQIVKWDGDWRGVFGLKERKLEEAKEAWDDTSARTVFVVD